MFCRRIKKEKEVNHVSTNVYFLDAKGISIISNGEINILSKRLVAEFSPLYIFTPKAIDIDRFVTKYMKLK